MLDAFCMQTCSLYCRIHALCKAVVCRLALDIQRQVGSHQTAQEVVNSRRPFFLDKSLCSGVNRTAVNDKYTLAGCQKQLIVIRHCTSVRAAGPSRTANLDHTC